MKEISPKIASCWSLTSCRCWAMVIAWHLGEADMARRRPEEAVMDWSIALEQQIAVKRTLTQIATSGREQANYFGDSRLSVLPGLRKSLAAACDGEAMFVEPDIVRALANEAEGVPDDWILAADMLVANPAFCWLGEPAAYARMADGIELALAGYSWATMVDDEGKPGLNVMALTHTAALSYPLAWFGWGWGTTLGERLAWLCEHRDQGPQSTERWGMELRFFAALVEFTSQRIVQRQRLAPSRAARRRLALPSVEHIPLITVVTLRRRAYPHINGEAERREYSHRFVVHSHWRRQWYASAGVHRPRLIASYVKGPDDKPLVLKRRVFDLAR